MNKGKINEWYINSRFGRASLTVLPIKAGIELLFIGTWFAGNSVCSLYESRGANGIPAHCQIEFWANLCDTKFLAAPIGGQTALAWWMHWDHCSDVSDIRLLPAWVIRERSNTLSGQEESCHCHCGSRQHPTSKVNIPRLKTRTKARVGMPVELNRITKTNNSNLHEVHDRMLLRNWISGLFTPLNENCSVLVISVCFAPICVYKHTSWRQHSPWEHRPKWLVHVEMRKLLNIIGDGREKYRLRKGSTIKARS